MLTVILFCFFIDHVLKSADHCFVLTGLSFLFRTFVMVWGYMMHLFLLIKDAFLLVP